MTPVKNPDLKAPRFRHKCVNVMTNKILDTVKSKSLKAKDVTLSDIRKVVNMFNGKMWNEVIESRDGVELPEALGNLYLVTCPPPKRKNIDMKKSIELGVAVEHRNWETDGHIGKVVYSLYGNKYKYKNSEIWSFKTGRDFKRSVSSRYPENWMLYKKIEKTMLISAQLKKLQKDEYFSSKDTSVPDTYNEFDLD